MQRFQTTGLLISALVISSCQPSAPLRARPARPAPILSPQSDNQIVVESPAPVSSSLPVRPPVFLTKSIGGIAFEGVAFDSRSHRLAVIDQPRGPGSVFASSEDVARRNGALLAINAGFFTPEGKPLGLVVANGTRSGAWNSASSLGSGIFAENSSGGLFITRRTSLSAAAGARELIQAGPLLVENGEPVDGLDRGKSAVRSILITDGGSRWWIGKTSSCTLAALGDALASSSPASWRTNHALNLDGGRSTDLFVSGKVSGSATNSRGFLNRPVRNFLILQPR